jgi:hypothetical protein
MSHDLRTIATVVGFLLAAVFVGTCLWFLFEAACRRHGWWPELFNINPSKGRSS